MEFILFNIQNWGWLDLVVVFDANIEYLAYIQGLLIFHSKK